MGLCKCPKRTVTNLFCFEHRVNVCEHCLVANHSKCIVQSYLKWLEDSDYNPVCGLCDVKLAEDDPGPTVRLLCYHVFHAACMDKYYSTLPHNTAPAGFVCNTCSEPLFPPRHQGGPVSEALRSYLNNKTWAREGLGLPLFENQATNDRYQMENESANEREKNRGDETENDDNDTNPSEIVNIVTHHPAFMPTNQVTSSPESSFREKNSDRSTRIESEVFIAKGQHTDNDENKYARKSIFTLISNLLKAHQINLSVSSQRLPSRKLARFGIYTAFLFLFVLTAVAILQTLSHYVNPDDNQDPMLNPRLNPNIKIESDLPR